MRKHIPTLYENIKDRYIYLADRKYYEAKIEEIFQESDLARIKI